MLLVVVGLAVVAHLVLFIPLPLIWQTAATLILTGLLPGWLLADRLLGPPQPSPGTRWEQGLYAVGLGIAWIVVVLLLLGYWPGSIQRWQTFLVFDGSLALLVGWRLWRPPAADTSAVPPIRLSKWLIAGWISLAFVGGFMRLPNLHYSEFQGDEARAVLMAAETIQGYGDTLLTHKKGPAEILLPAASYALTGHLTESTARLPFALANLAGLFAIYLLGWRLFHPVAGWSAAMLLAVDGYFIGFSRIVQYQSLVFLCVVLAVLVIYRLVERPERMARRLTAAAIFCATGLLAHYEAALVGIPILYLLYTIWRRGTSLVQLGRALIAPIVVGSALLASFYVPFVLHPAFRVTYAYITVNRIGVASEFSYPYNNLVDVFQRSTLYSSSYYFLLLVVCTLAVPIVLYRRNLPGWAAWLASAVLVAGVFLTFLRPAWLVIGGQDHTWFFFALAALSVWFLPDFSSEERLVWLWFSVPMVLMLFFTLTPNTHVYGFYIPWVLISGMAIGWAWQTSARRWGVKPAAWIALPVAAALLLVFGVYEFWYFVATDVEVLRTWRVNRPKGYWINYDMPTSMSIFGFPLKNGWKAVGVLYADGVLDAPFELHGKEPVADWYTRGTGYCPRDHIYYIWHESVEPAQQGYNTVVQQQIEEKGYQLYGEIMVNGEGRLRIYKQTPDAITPQSFEIADYEDRFDRDLSGPMFENDGPIAPAVAKMEQSLALRFGDAIHLRGYHLSAKELKPGDGLWLTLYWDTDRPLATDYSVFTQVIDMQDFYKAGQRDGEPVCNNLPTGAWPTDTLIADRYYIPIEPDAPPGTYALLVGMYEGESGERLDIFGPEGQPVGDAVGLDEITVLAAP